ncbi:Uncharacterized protein ChrSV_4172 [Chromobacterium vaccinii]|uniref:Uncharacterized protein n=1 Tax=Chromobacterium piscinae TaxID=686831 RepID=A0ABV0HAC8_9NEIS|nr:hypothetical protein [Chromobacterium vaccinii]AVG16324.1 hypothetical protein CFN79_10960 [Chromobacterium vaccinii]QND86398.1 Uncharacterized protein ChrSW_4172 [Chromobacterium vaccinii]QND91629.1 Uncharacterized protein ChrSV_4172 [Chromobacterium vaccinii]
MIAVRFTAPYGIYTPGDVAGFEGQARVDELIARGVAALEAEDDEGEPAPVETKPAAKSKAKAQPGGE